MSRLPRYWPIVAVFVAMTILQASVSALSIQLLSTVRAYVAGESLYSKAQKDAQIYLLDYAEKHREVDYVRFMSVLAIPLGDQAAREALQQSEPDVEAARRGFMAGGNHPDDIDGLIRMFRWFQRVPFMSKPIATWTEGDRTIGEMRAMVERAHEGSRTGEAHSAAVQAMLLQSPNFNDRLTRLTGEFSAQLGEASRTTQRLLLGLNTCIAVLLMISGLGFVRRTIRMQATSDLRMERLIHAVTEGVVAVDEDRRIVLFNRAAETMFGVEANEALGGLIDRFVEHLAIANDPATEVVPSSAGSLQALTGRKRDGRAFPIEASLSRLQTAQGTLTTIVLRDITVRIVADAERRALEALEASSKAKTEFLSRMSHELRTPLNAVIGFSQLLRLDASKPLSAGQLERVQHVENAGAHLLALVNDVLDLSRIESGEMSVSSQAVPLLRVIEEAATMVSPLVTKAGVEVFLAAELPASDSSLHGDARRAPPGDVWVDADPVRLRQVLVNLLSNAVKYNRPGGRVALTWRRSKSGCEILITDTGQGIPADQLAGLFQPFNRLGAESSTVEGTGIGLVLSRQLAEMMGGTLTVTSTFGVGTCARLSLGVANPPAASSSPARTVRSESRSAPVLSVLYAEDDEVNAELVRQLVTMRVGVSLRVATNGAMALASARADPPDLMLVDMNLGDMTGIELAREMRRDRSTRDVRLVALSADALPEQIRAAMACGFESYLTKPINFEQVLALLDAHGQEAVT
jgi:PAS domain S-box-containing protein